MLLMLIILLDGSKSDISKNKIGSSCFDADGWQKVNMKFIIGNWKIIIIIIYSLEKRSQLTEVNTEHWRCVNISISKTNNNNAC